MIMGLIFLCGIANFAIHKAVLESGHPLVSALPDALRAHGGRVSLGLEFLLLLIALSLTRSGWHAVGWLYAGYSALNALAGWMLLTRRM